LLAHPADDLRGSGDEIPLRPRARAPIRDRGIRATRLLTIDAGPLGVNRAQFGLENFAVIVLWQCVDEDVILRTLEAGNRVEAKPVELAGRRIADDIGNDHLAPFAVRAARSQRLRSRGGA